VGGNKKSGRNRLLPEFTRGLAWLLLHRVHRRFGSRSPNQNATVVVHGWTTPLRLWSIHRTRQETNKSAKVNSNHQIASCINLGTTHTQRRSAMRGGKRELRQQSTESKQISTPPTNKRGAGVTGSCVSSASADEARPGQASGAGKGERAGTYRWTGARAGGSRRGPGPSPPAAGSRPRAVTQQAQALPTRWSGTRAWAGPAWVLTGSDQTGHAWNS